MGFKKAIGYHPLVGAATGKGPFGGIKGLLFGKDQTIGEDPEAAYLRETALIASQAQRKGLESLLKNNANPAEIAQAQIGQNVAAEKANLEDQRRTIQQSIARRGLQNTSIGLGSLLGAERGAGRNISELLASQPMLERQLMNEQSDRLINAGAKVSSAQNVPIRFRSETTRKGGLAPLLGMAGGAAIGGSLGGPQGAALGAQLGGGAGTAAQGAFG